MNSAVALSVGAELLVGAAATSVAVVAWRYRQRPAGVSLFVMGVVGVVYTATTVAETLVTDPLVWGVVVGFQYPLTAVVAVTSVSVATELIPSSTDYRHAVRWLVVGVVVPSFVLGITNPIHGLLVAGPRETAGGVLVVTIGPLFLAAYDCATAGDSVQSGAFDCRVDRSIGDLPTTTAGSYSGAGD